MVLVAYYQYHVWRTCVYVCGKINFLLLFHGVGSDGIWSYDSTCLSFLCMY